MSCSYICCIINFCSTTCNSSCCSNRISCTVRFNSYRCTSAGRISASKLRHTLAAWTAVQPVRWCSYHSAAKLWKVFCRAAIRSCLACFLASPGSCPAASRRRALSAASRASSREIRGYFPIDSVFRLLAIA